MNFVIIIPARFFSSRFPGKLLADIHGKPMIIRVIERALTSQADKIIVATDNFMIKQAVESEYFKLTTKPIVEVCLTQSTHQSGTERLAEVVDIYQFSNTQILVHLQGDEPLIESSMIHQVVQSLSTTNISMSTLVTPIRSLEEAKDNNVVKVIINKNNEALYFSRSMIPWNKKYNYIDYTVNMLFRHIGIYSYHVSFLRRYIKWGKSPLEQLEMLEQLRVLWNNEKIKVSIINNLFNIGVDNPESLQRVNKLFLK